MTKQLTDKAIDIKGKKYVLVSDRVLYFNETYPNWCIQTQRIMVEESWVEVFKATVIPDCEHMDRYFTGYSQAKWGDWFINKTSALENAETSAVGRALAMMWIWVIDSIASVDEINKAENTAKAQKSESKENPQWRFQKATTNKEFMEKCMDEDNYVRTIKGKYEVDDIVESQLREAYRNLMWKNEDKSDSLPFE